MTATTSPAVAAAVPAQASPVEVRARAGRKAPRPEAVKLPQHAHLTLTALRAYRQTLTDEESRVSYWRRILQARLDVLQAGSGKQLDSARLRPVLTDERVGSGRRALVEIVPVDDIPPLPDLAGLWDRQVDATDPEACAALEAALVDAEHQLSDYRAVLHTKLSEATSELIARYRDEPSLVTSALPLPPARRRASA